MKPQIVAELVNYIGWCRSYLAGGQRIKNVLSLKVFQ
jgi:hypothetical protein